jgi:hypothetical protein
MFSALLIWHGLSKRINLGVVMLSAQVSVYLEGETLSKLQLQQARDHVLEEVLPCSQYRLSDSTHKLVCSGAYNLEGF